MKVIKDKSGIALISIYIVIAVLLVFVGAYVSRSFNEFKFSLRQEDEQKAYYIAEAGINQAAMGIYQAFQPIAYTAWMNGTYEADFRNVVSNYTFPSNITTSDGLTYSVMLPANTDPVVVTPDGALLKLIAVGIAPHMGDTVRKVIASTISYEMGPSPIFNYAYFINNYGWMWGGGIDVNGDVRSNGNFSFRGNPLINGDIYAAENAELGAAGTITGNSRNWDIAQYDNKAPDTARPTDPTDPANPGGTVYEGGYSGTSSRHENQDTLDMPYLGDLTGYKNLARSKGGKITQNGAVLVDAVYEGNGPDGAPGTPDDGTIVLIGTEASPIEVTGPVVINKDIIIRGVVKGQGSIYAGRNVHIVGDITYSDAPSWPKPDADPQATAGVNKTKDFVGLASKGNVIVGDYTRNDWQRSCAPYLSPPFTQGYATDASDAALGYDSDGDPSNGYWFDGNYMANDGGLKDDGAGGTTQRKFYEASVSDDLIRSIASPSSQIRNVAGVSYTNHAWSGRVGKFTLDGSVVARDEGIVYSGSININYDARAYDDGVENIDIYLPRDLALPGTKARQGT